MSQLTHTFRPRPAHLAVALVLVVALTVAERMTARAESVAPSTTVAHALAASRVARSVWDSVYSVAQATRGDSLYRATCAKCHGDTLSGGTSPAGEDAPSLRGSAFLDNYYGLSIAELYDKIRNGMPPDNPKTIDPQVVVDVMAFLLSKNQFPAGATDLPNDVAKLKEIMMEKSKAP